jgi:RecA/RadA recombinase
MVKKKEVNTTEENYTDALIHRIEKHYKIPIIQRAAEVSTPHLLRRPTFIASLDIALGGGFPAGGISQIASPSGIGKNSLCNHTIGICQKIYGEKSNIAWCPLETPYDKYHAKINGAVVPLSDHEIEMEQKFRAENGLDLLIVDEIKERKQQIGQFFIINRGNTAQRLQAIVELVQENLCQIIVLDSLASVVSEAREETDLDDEAQQSAEARLITEFQKKLWHAFGNPVRGFQNYTTLLIINQVRANRARRNMYDSEWQVGGAYAVRHAKLIDLTLYHGQKIYITPTGKESSKKDKTYDLVGKQVGWTLTKGKAGCHEGPSGEMSYYYTAGFNRARDLAITAKNFGLIETHSGKKSGDTYTISDSTGLELESGSGDLFMVEKVLAEKSSLFELVYRHCLLIAGIHYLHQI